MSVQVSSGNKIQPNGTVAPSYAPAVTVLAQVQPMTWRDLQQVEHLNLQGTRKAIYLSGRIEGLVRELNDGGDLVTLPDGSVWLVAQVLEGFSLTAGWTKCAITLQDGS